MKIKEKGLKTRAEVSEFLEDLAVQIKEGRISLRDWEGELPEKIEFKLKLEAEGKETELTIEIKAGTRAPGPSPYQGPSSSKALKKEISRLFNQIKKTFRQGGAPLDQDLRAFVELHERWRPWAQEFSASWEEALGLAQRLEEAFKNGSQEEIAALISRIDLAKKLCHKTYKK